MQHLGSLHAQPQCPTTREGTQRTFFFVFDFRHSEADSHWRLRLDSSLVPGTAPRERSAAFSLIARELSPKALFFSAVSRGRAVVEAVTAKQFADNNSPITTSPTTSQASVQSSTDLRPQGKPLPHILRPPSPVTPSPSGASSLCSLYSTRTLTFARHPAFAHSPSAFSVKEPS